MAQSSLAAIAQSYAYVQERGPLSNDMFSWIVNEGNRLRSIFALTFGGTPEDYALTQNATEGCNIIMWGVEWKEGERLLLTDSEHNGVVESAKQLAKRRGLKLDYCPVASAKSDDEFLSSLKESLKLGPRLFVLSHVLWNTGRLLPAREIVKLCHENNCLVLIDGAQSAGVIPFNLSKLEVDYYAMTGHKWLGGPEGVGSLYVNPAALEQIEPTFVGWRSTKYGAADSQWLPGAARFESATAPFPLMSGLLDAFTVHNNFGSSEERFQLISANSEKLRNAIRNLPGLQLLSDLSDSGGSGLVSFTVDAISQSELVRKLEENYKIIVRTIPYPHSVRASVHYFSEQDVNAMATAMSEILRN